MRRLFVNFGKVHCWIASCGDEICCSHVSGIGNNNANWTCYVSFLSLQLCAYHYYYHHPCHSQLISTAQSTNAISPFANYLCNTLCESHRFTSVKPRLPKGWYDQTNEPPIVQLPARTLWQIPYPLEKEKIESGEYDEMISNVRTARHYFQYPSLCAQQIGWNVQMFTLFDNSVFINPEIVSYTENDNYKTSENVNNSSSNNSNNIKIERGLQYIWEKYQKENLKLPANEVEERLMKRLRDAHETCFGWEPCASCCTLMHYIERPRSVRIRALNEFGKTINVTLHGMQARMALHEIDHLHGVLFTRRVVDSNHVVPLAAFTQMSEWKDDFPSLEARSTYLYTLFTPPYRIVPYSVEDANLLDRHFEDGVYPGAQFEKKQQINLIGFDKVTQAQWEKSKEKPTPSIVEEDEIAEEEDDEHEKIVKEDNNVNDKEENYNTN